MDKGTLEAIRRSLNDIRAQIAVAERERAGKQIDVDKLCRALERTIREFFQVDYRPPLIRKSKKKVKQKQRKRMYSNTEIEVQKEAILNVLNTWTHYNGWMTHNEVKRHTGFNDGIVSSRLMMLMKELKIIRKDIYRWDGKYGDVTQRTGTRGGRAKICIYRVRKYDKRFI